MLPGLTPQIDFHPSVGEEALAQAAIESLQANRIDPKFLYVSPRQAELWRQVFLKHSPIHGNPEFARIYHEAFTRTADNLPGVTSWLVGLGCGTGFKEAELCSLLKERGRRVLFSAIDFSRDLVEESMRKLEETGAELQGSLVSDLAELTFLREWLAHTKLDAQRLFTFFGLVPNLAPSLVVRLFREILLPGDILLVSAHLAPIGVGVDLASAMRKVLPQYDNPETLAWLYAGLEQWGLKDLLEEPEMQISEVEGIPAFVATARWKSDETFERWGHWFFPGKEEPIQLFHSLRYTPALFENMLRGKGFNVVLLAMTSCREEAIWSVTV